MRRIIKIRWLKFRIWLLGVTIESNESLLAADKLEMRNLDADGDWKPTPNLMMPNVRIEGLAAPDSERTPTAAKYSTTITTLFTTKTFRLQWHKRWPIATLVTFTKWRLATVVAA